MAKHTLDPKRLGLACGILWCAGVLFMAIISMLFGTGPLTWQLISEWYIGAGPTPSGALIGTIWAFFDGGIGGYVLAWLYNQL